MREKGAPGGWAPSLLVAGVFGVAASLARQPGLSVVGLAAALEKGLTATPFMVIF